MDAKEYKYITIREAMPGARQRVFHVKNKKSGEALGCVQWYAPWRQYCFMVLPSHLKSHVFSRGCLEDVAAFLDGLMEERKG
jgi:hypothetical protein